MKRHALALVLTLLPGFAAAQSVQDSIVQQLQSQGFSEFRVNRTLLGRVRIVALRDDLRREIVLNPTTGEILRDYWRDRDDDDDGSGPRIVTPPAPGEDGGDDDEEGGDDNEDDDDDGEDDDDDDEDGDDD